jgi:hypothetical protein
VICSVPPAASDVEGALTATDDSTGTGVTVREVELCTDCPPTVAVAVMVVVPAAIVVASPDPLTLATDDTEDDHETFAVIAFPLWSCGAAVNWTVCPATTDCACGEIDTDVRTALLGAV